MNDNDKENIVFYLSGVVVVSLLWLVLLCVVCHADVVVDMARIAKIESNNNALAWNKAEDGRGLFQVNPICLREWNNFHPRDQHTPDDLFRAHVNAKIASWYMTVRIPKMIKHYGKPDTIENRIIAWNAGINYVKTGKAIPKTTQKYIEKYKRG